MFRVINKPLKGWVYYLLYCKINECVLNIQCHNNKTNQSVILMKQEYAMGLLLLIQTQGHDGTIFYKTVSSAR